MIELTDIEKSYPLAAGRHYVLRKISLHIDEGDFLSIMGPSGSGKTSLLSVLGLLDAQFSGSYRFDGIELSGLKEHEPRTSRASTSALCSSTTTCSMI